MTKTSDTKLTNPKDKKSWVRNVRAGLKQVRCAILLTTDDRSLPPVRKVVEPVDHDSSAPRKDEASSVLLTLNRTSNRLVVVAFWMLLLL